MENNINIFYVRTIHNLPNNQDLLYHVILNYILANCQVEEEMLGYILDSWKHEDMLPAFSR